MSRRKWLSTLLLNLVNRGMNFERFNGNERNAIKNRVINDMAVWLISDTLANGLWFFSYSKQVDAHKKQCWHKKDMPSFPIF